MDAITSKEKSKNGVGEPVWEIAHLFPYQGDWSEEEYLALNTNLLIEYTDGQLEVLPMPTLAHQFITLYLYDLLRAFVEKRSLGRVLTAPLRVRMRPKKYREPDVIFLSTERLKATQGEYPNGAELVVEVVSGSVEDRYRDLVT